MNTLLILPNQLFAIKYIPTHITYIYIHLHPHYFQAYKYNKKKLLLHYASIEYYKEYISKKYKLLDNIPSKYVMFDSADDLKLLKLKPLQIYDNPNFLLTNIDHHEYLKKTKSFKFHPFYMYFKKKLNYLPNEKSYDKQNRKKLPANIKIPRKPSNKIDQKWIDMVVSKVDNEYPEHYGNTKNFIFPVTHKSAKLWLDHFIKNRLDNFGTYQDAIHTSDPFLFHSLLAPAMNIGLIHPTEIIERIIRVDTAMNNKEGFIRQLFWREYQLYCYRHFNFQQSYFHNKEKLDKRWYYGTLDIPPVDQAIQRAFDSGYLHHIERLMVIGNYMNLSGIHEKEGFRWFMEFSCDSYEWVMHQNVLDMVFCISGGQTTRRPYISSSNYIRKMSNHLPGDWEQKWDLLYSTFKTKHKQKLHKFRYYI